MFFSYFIQPPNAKTNSLCVLTYLAIKTNKENSDSTVQYSMCAMWPADCSVWLHMGQCSYLIQFQLFKFGLDYPFILGTSLLPHGLVRSLCFFDLSISTLKNEAKEFSSLSFCFFLNYFAHNAILYCFYYNCYFLTELLCRCNVQNSYSTSVLICCWHL